MIDTLLEFVRDSEAITLNGKHATWQDGRNEAKGRPYNASNIAIACGSARYSLNSNTVQALNVVNEYKIIVYMHYLPAITLDRV